MVPPKSGCGWQMTATIGAFATPWGFQRIASSLPAGPSKNRFFDSWGMVTEQNPDRRTRHVAGARVPAIQKNGPQRLKAEFTELPYGTSEQGAENVKICHSEPRFVF